MFGELVGEVFGEFDAVAGGGSGSDEGDAVLGGLGEGEWSFGPECCRGGVGWFVEAVGPFGVAGDDESDAVVVAGVEELFACGEGVGDVFGDAAVPALECVGESFFGDVGEVLAAGEILGGDGVERVDGAEDGAQGVCDGVCGFG